MNRRRAPRAGFTLIELMISLTVGGIALGSIYAVGAASTQHFREQQRVANTQTSLRMAMAQLKKDFQRAGFLGTPNAALPAEQCAPPVNTLHAPGATNPGGISAVSWFNNAVTPLPTNVDPAGTNNVTIHDVVLTGNYSTSGEYSGVTVTGGTTLTVSQNWQSFRRDFTDWYGTNLGQVNQAVFNDAFTVGRMMRIHTLGERHWFTQIGGVAFGGGATPVTVSFAPGLPAGCNANNGWISPLNTIRYSVVNATANTDEAARFANSSSPIAVLRRTEVDPVTKRDALLVNGVAVDDRSVLDYVVGFQLQFWRTDATPSSVNLAIPATLAEVIGRPESLRAVTITLSVRTPEEDPRLGSLVGTPPRTFDVFADRPGRARVRTLRSEIFLPNISFEGYP